ncbi:MAG: glycosyltransferase family A protein [Fibrobacteria bacterium]
MPAPSICLALVTYNQAPLLRYFLDNYFRYGAGIPLLVIDDGSEDGTAALLREAAAHPGVSIRHEPHASIAHARNMALRACATPWMAFSDTDCILGKTYFDTLAEIPSRFPLAAAVEGAVRPSPGPKPPFTHSMHNPTGGTYATANMVFQVASALALGGFDEAFPFYREDADLALTIIDRLGPIPFCPELIVEHPHLPRSFPNAVREAFGSQSRKIQAEMRLYSKHPRSYALVRHYPDARGTLLAWCRKYSGLYLKECLGYLFRTPGLTAAQRLRGLTPAAEAVLVAILEQTCIGAICAMRSGEIARLNGLPGSGKR